jgi:PAS domain S-box-containing protein
MREERYCMDELARENETLRRQVAALEAEARRFRATLYSIGDAVITTDAHGTVVQMNPVAETLTGWSEREAQGRACAEVFKIVNEETRATALSPIERVLREGVVVGLANHTMLIARDGAERPIADSGAPIRDEQGEIAGVVLVFRDRTEERTAQKALAESERKFREAIRYLDEGYYRCTLDGVLREHNVAFNRMLGFPGEQDLQGSRLPDFWQHPEDRNDYLSELSSTGFVRNYLIHAKTIGGDHLVVMANSHLVRDETGRPVGIEGTFSDFTERMRLEEALKESEEKYRTLFDNAEVGMYRSRLDGSGIIALNQRLADLFGFTKEEMMTSPATIRWADPGAREKMVRLVRERGELRDHEIDIVTKSGEVRTTLASVKLHPLAGYLEGSAVDITERKRTEASLRQSEHRLRRFYESGLLGVIYWNMQGQITDANDKFLEMVGYTRAELEAGQIDWLSMTPPEYRHLDDASVAELMATGVNKAPFEKEYIRKDGTRMPIALAGAMLDEERVNGVAFVLDIAERKRMEEQLRSHRDELEQRVRARTAELEASNRELEAFSYSVSHDLRAPLRAVDGFTRILADDYAPQLDAEGQRLCSIIHENTGKMGRLIDDLLAFSRLGRAEMSLSRVDMETLAGSVFHELTTPESRARIDLHVGPLPRALADPTLMRQVWTNLLSNAIKFSSKRERAVIRVSARQSGGETIYAVQDNGAGFDMQYVGKLFGVFQRLHSTREFEGTGVGLALVQRVIRRHGGRVWAEGETDRGADFYFALTEKGN